MKKKNPKDMMTLNTLLVKIRNSRCVRSPFNFISFIVRLALEYKEQGNEFFKQGDLKKAVAKYARVQCYTNAVMPPKSQDVAMY